MNITSAAGIISLLEEPMPELKVFALKKLDLIVDEFWPEISEAIEKIEILHEDKKFQQHQLAALVASKVYYHLGSFEDSLTYALGAGELFDVNSHNEYVETTIAKCIDYYTQQRIAGTEATAGDNPIDPRLEAIVNRMFQRCLDDGQYRQALGLALETRRMDIFESSITQSDDVGGMLSYAFQVAMSLIQNRGFRNTVLRTLVGLYRGLTTPDYVNMCQCLIFLDDPMSVAEILDRLAQGKEESQLMAYQIAFDMYESATQQFLGRVLGALKATAPLPSALTDRTKPVVAPVSTPTSTVAETTTPIKEEKEEAIIADDVKMEERSVDSLNDEEKEHQERIEKLSSILSGSVSIDLHLQFLIRSNHTDMLILKNTKDAIRVSICHTATVIANAFMHSGTTSDQFLRDNLEWLARATNWAKLTATASLGVIHRGHEQEALALMQSYLPKEVGPSSGYSEGGGLYALGLIHANHGANIIDYLLQQLKDAQNEMVRHGGCLGLGLAAMGTHRQDVYEQLKFNLYQDDAATGEAAGIAMGMVMLGSKHAPAIEDMVAYAQESQHEKILRGLAVGIAFTMYGRLEEADVLITSLCSDKDPILRRSGMYTLAMAYCGTGHNQAIRKLLHVAVSDVNDDVRRAAVTALGFLLFRGCQQVQRAARRRAKSLGIEGKSVRIPRCNNLGAFESIQCDNEIVSSCWCVDEEGFELAGTRAPAAALVNCTAPKDCAAHTCRMFCPMGFALAEDGCPLCRCRDPCDEVKCPDSLSCLLEEVTCSDPPCPPIPSCKRGRSLENFCPIGDPLKIIESGLPFLCGNDPGKPTCPPMFQCLVKNGHDYGVCCPASLQIQKAGQCPVDQDEKEVCGMACQHDLECHSIEKCCESSKCNKHCVHPQNLTECYHQKRLADILSVNERAGKGYIPQCSEDGQFEPKQCSRNGLVCWCVDKAGHKVKGSMSAAANVSCTITEARTRTNGRSIDSNSIVCEHLDCAAVCEYGFKMDEDGCPTCKCDNPCEGFTCPEEEECIAVKESTCTDFLCPTLPVCRPKALYTNPCNVGTPLIDDLAGVPVMCNMDDSIKCPTTYLCTSLTGTKHSICCPNETETEVIDDGIYEIEIDNNTGDLIIEVAIEYAVIYDTILEDEATEKLENTTSQETQEVTQQTETDRPQSMCEYLRDFSDSMEGTQEGMTMALITPICNATDGSYLPQQCYKGDCWCVDYFGTEIPRTRAKGKSAEDCQELRSTLDCLDLTCRMGCEYGFELDEDTRCPKCHCKDPCSAVKCSDMEQCQLVEVSCKDYYCPPVPACLPRKTGQCPYLVPASSTSCDYECNSDLACNGTAKCCSNGCGTQCTEPLQLTACQHKKTVAQHQSHESGVPAGKVYMPQCKEDGSFEPLQCNPGTKECWCVDFRGFEVSSTRAPASTHINCSAPPKSNCPLYKCAQDCEHGFEIDEDGCRSCKCVEPCDKIACKGEGETCRMVQVDCVTLPCPSVPMCLPKKENPCQHGNPLLAGDEQVSCGPDFESCPSSHKCQLSPLGEYAVCCPKPRDVCFEAKDDGSCSELESARNLTRWYFNPRSNSCESFVYSGCQGNHNNFHTELMCNQVCPVLSQCERLREKNQRVSERYNKPTFAPRCDPDTGVWSAVQCLEHVSVCWCVSPQGEPLKGTLTRGAEPDCNFRKARRKNMKNDDDSDIVFEEIIMQIGTIEEPDIDSTDSGSSIVYWEQPVKTRCQALGAQCDSQGRFNPKQCDGNICWCVDEAGNQLPSTNTFTDGEQICLPTPIDTVEVTIGFRGEFDSQTAEEATKQMRAIITGLKGTIVKEEITAETTSDALYVRFSLEGNNKVDVAFRLEEMVTEQSMENLIPDITRSQFIHRLEDTDGGVGNRIIALEHREIVDKSPVSVVAPYHTALIVIAAGSAFIISILTLLVLLYRRKASGVNTTDSIKEVDNKEHFLVYSQPIYIELPKDKNESLSSLESDINKEESIRV